MQTHEHGLGTSSVSPSPAPGSETVLTIPKGYTRPEISSSGYSPGLVDDFFVEWQLAAGLARAGQRS